MHYRRFLPSFAIAVTLMVPLAAASAATETAWSGFEEVPVRLVAGQTAIADTTAEFGLEFRIGSNWKTYWRYPGESGAPPQLDWSGSENVSSVAVAWPAPARFSSFGFDSFGFHDELMLPLSVQARDPAAGVKLALRIDYLVCSDICVPAEAELKLNLEPGTPASTAHATRIREARAQVPQKGEAAPFALDKVTLEGEPGKEVLVVDASSAEPFGSPDAMIESGRPFSLGRPEVSLSDDGRQARLRMVVYDGRSKRSLAGETLRLTLVDGRRASEHSLVVSR